jgi:CubicO group peptidase (beta-lactamase class C family)
VPVPDGKLADVKICWIRTLLLVVGCARPVPVLPAVDSRASRVEAGLRTPVVVKGEPSRMTIADRMRFHHVPGMSVAVVDHGRIAWAKGYGVTEAGGTTPVTVDTLFQAASISKPVAAMGALALVDRGVLRLDEDVNFKLKSWKVPETDLTRHEKVTLRRLASHTAGLTVHGFRGYAAGEPIPTVRQILDGEKPANSDPIRVDTAPGGASRYSGGGFVVMQLLMTEVTGKPFPALMRELVLDRLGMANSTYQQPLPPELAGRAAAGHDDKGRMIGGRWFSYPEMAPAGLWTTAADLARFLIDLQQTRAGRSARVISQASATLMLTPHGTDYGLGLGLRDGPHGRSFNHNGSNVGFKCQMIGGLNAAYGVVVMTNGDHGGPLADEVVRAVADEYGWSDYRPIERAAVPVDPQVLRSYVGEYDLEGKVTVTFEEGALFVQPPRNQKTRIYPLSPTEFFVTVEDLTLSFTRDGAGAVTGLAVHIGRRTQSGPKMK